MRSEGSRGTLIRGMNALRDRLEAIDLVPASVVGWHLEEGRDHTGDPAVWVYVIVDDDRIEEIWPIWDALRAEIRRVVVAETSPDVIPYVRMWAKSEVGDQAAAG